MHAWKKDERCIFHVDVNSAFLSWSALKALREDPQSVDLRTIPSAVGGDVKTRHGIITAKSIPAKKYGVQTGEPVVKALQKCPGLVLVRSDFETYRSYSRAFISILREYTDLVEQVSIDEAYLDMTGCRDQLKLPETQDQPWPLNAAHAIRLRVFRELGFTVNVGISTNKLLAKMASDFEKPDKVHTLFPEEVPAKMWPLPIRDLHGCGKATEERLRQMGIETIGDAAGMPEEVLKASIGEKAGSYIWRSANGISMSLVHVSHEKAKSCSNEETTSEDINIDNYRTKGVEIVRRLSRKVASRLERGGFYAQTIGVNVKTGEFRRHSRQVTLASPTRDPEVITREAEALMDELLSGEDGLFASGEVLRLIGVGCSGLTDGSYLQMDLFSWARTAEESARQKAEAEAKAAREKAEAEARAKERDKAEEKKRRLEAMLKKVRSRYGDDAIRTGDDI
ncbi:MAG: DNA polymerase IV [Lachnospiraceae bacterium]|nr:DNA polymerase IV [Lachnospiraceae bacterium]